jgi:hypothetical protein
MTRWKADQYSTRAGRRKRTLATCRHWHRSWATAKECSRRQPTNNRRLLLVDWQREGDAAARALVYIDLAVLRLAQSDDGWEIHDRALELLALISPEAKPRLPGPYSGT